jgi:hypothetical protein
MHALLVALVLLHGVVRTGPTTPVCQLGERCTRPDVGVTLLFSRSGTDVARAVTDTRGRYAVRLRPALYSVRLARPPRIGSGLKPRKLTVPKAESVRADFFVDTGIR